MNEFRKLLDKVNDIDEGGETEADRVKTILSKVIADAKKYGYELKGRNGSEITIGKGNSSFWVEPLPHENNLQVLWVHEPSGDSMNEPYDEFIHTLMDYEETTNEEVDEAIEETSQTMNDMRKLIEMATPLFQEDELGVQETLGAPSTLERIKAEGDDRRATYAAKGMRVGDAPEVMAMEPNEEYPAPWRARGRPSEPWSVIANNGRTVVTWVSRADAEQVVADVEAIGEASLNEFNGEGSEVGYEIDEIAQQIMDLAELALKKLPGGMVKERARSYWYGQIMSAAGHDDYAGQSMVSMQDTVSDLHDEDDSLG